MHRIIRRAALMGAVSLLGCLGGSVAQAKSESSVKLLTTIHVTNSSGAVVDPSNFDIAWVDQDRGRYYLSDGTNNAVDVVNTKTDKFLGFIGQGQFSSANAACTAIPGVGPYDCNAPKGIVTDKWGRVWVGNASSGSGSTVLVLNPDRVSKSLAPNPASVIATIPTGGQVAADEMAYDPRDNIVFIANPAAPDASVTWISASTLKVLGTYTFPSTGFNGIEQTVWNQRTDEFEVNLPGTTSTGGIAVFRATSPGSAPVTTYQVPDCGAGSPAGLVLLGENLFSACSNGLAETNALRGIRGPLFSALGGGDEIAANPLTDSVFVPVSTTDDLGVLNARSGRVTLVPTGTTWNRAQPAVYYRENRIYLAETTGTAGLGIQVFSQRREDHADRAKRR